MSWLKSNHNSLSRDSTSSTHASRIHAITSLHISTLHPNTFHLNIHHDLSTNLICWSLQSPYIIDLILGKVIKHTSFSHSISPWILITPWILILYSFLHCFCYLGYANVIEQSTYYWINITTTYSEVRLGTLVELN